MFKSILVFAFALFSLACLAQKEDDYPPDKPEAKAISNFIFQFDNRNERYYGERAKMNGLKLGLESFKRVRYGFGFYQNPRSYPFLYPGRPSEISQTFSLKYNVVWSEIVPFKGFRYEIALPVAYGKGLAYVKNFEKIGTTTDYRYTGTDTVQGLKVLDLGINGYYKPIPFVGIGAGIGYRTSLVDAPKFNEPLSDVYFDFKLKFFVGYVYKAIFKPGSIKEEKAYYKYRKKQRKEKRKKK